LVAAGACRNHSDALPLRELRLLVAIAAAAVKMTTMLRAATTFLLLLRLPTMMTTMTM
jgi:hypothetical protein